jgi:sn-glycerol 3-phosphate transport system permease protein
MAVDVTVPPAHTGPVRRGAGSARRGGGTRGSTLPRHLALLATCLLLGAPILYALLVATQNNAQVFSFQLTPGGSFASNLEIVMGRRNLGTYMLNSTLQAIIITAAKTVTALLAGLAFVYFDFPGKWAVFGIVLITLMMPTEISILALFRIVNDIGWRDNLAGLTVPFFASATGAFLFRQHFASIPSELSEAAQLDGASPLQFLWRILIPLSWNTIGALAVIQFVYAWNMYLWPLLIVSDQERQLVQVGLGTLLQASQGQTFGPLMLAAVIASLPPVVVFMALQKPFMAGFALSSDK